MLGIKSTAFVYVETLLKVQQKYPVFLIVVGSLTVLIYVNFVEGLEFSRNQLISDFEKLVFKQVWK